MASSGSDSGTTKRESIRLKSNGLADEAIEVSGDAIPVVTRLQNRAKTRIAKQPLPLHPSTQYYEPLIRYPFI